MCKNMPNVSKLVWNIKDKFNDRKSKTSEKDYEAYTMEHISRVEGPKKCFVDLNVNLPGKAATALTSQSTVDLLVTV